jgi:sulfite reductase (NADPH) hemoprotein beta-component
MAATPMRGPGIHPGTVRLQPMSDTYLRWMRRNVTRQRQAGYCHVTARLPLGDFTAGQMRVLADLADAYGDGTMRLTIEQNVLFRWVRTESLEPFYQRLAAAGLNAPDAMSMSDVVSCPGAESCRLAVTQSRGLGRVLTEYFSARPDLVDAVPSGSIRISGCPNGCGQHHIGSLGFQGSVRKVAGKALPQYFVLVGGGVTDEGAHFGKVVAKVPARRIVEATARLVDLYREQRTSDAEELGAFYRRIQPSIAADRLKDLVELNASDTTAEDFIDLGESQAFDPVVMDGECSA